MLCAISVHLIPRTSFREGLGWVRLFWYSVIRLLTVSKKGRTGLDAGLPQAWLSMSGSKEVI